MRQQPNTGRANYDAYRRPEDRQYTASYQNDGYGNYGGNAPYNGGYDGSYAPYGNAPQSNAYGDQPYDDGYGEAPYTDAYDQPPYEENYDQQSAYDEPYDDRPANEDDDWEDQHSKFEPQVIATNSTVRLTCTLASMMGLFGLFLCFAEKKSNAIRHFARQSAGLMIANAVCALLLLVIGSLLGAIPLMGFLINLVCWLCYIVVLIVTVFMKVRMMLYAWRGWRFTLPVIGKRLEKMD